MRLLISADGPGLDARVAHRFEKAAWFLLVDPHTLAIESFHHAIPHDQDGLLRNAGAGGVAGVIAGRMGTLAFGLIQAQDIPMYSAGGMTVREAIARLSRGLLPERSRPDRRSGLLPLGQRLFFLPRRNTAERAKSVVEAMGGGSERGRHRLQQYGGRGH
jgi:predicted Fe-Mo cluster-binding NifX family protein